MNKLSDQGTSLWILEELTLRNGKYLMMKSFCRSIGDVIATDDATMVENIFSGKLYTTNSLMVDFI